MFDDRKEVSGVSIWRKEVVGRARFWLKRISISVAREVLEYSYHRASMSASLGEAPVCLQILRQGGGCTGDRIVGWI